MADETLSPLQRLAEQIKKNEGEGPSPLEQLAQSTDRAPSRLEQLTQAGPGRTVAEEDRELIRRFGLDPSNTLTFSEHRKSYEGSGGPLALAQSVADGAVNTGRMLRDMGVAVPNILGQLSAQEVPEDQQKSLLEALGAVPSEIAETSKEMLQNWSWKDPFSVINPKNYLRQGSEALDKAGVYQALDPQNVTGVMGEVASLAVNEAKEDWKMIGRGATQLPARTFFKGMQALGVYNESWGEEWDRKDDKARYLNYLRNTRRATDLSTTLKNLSEAYNIREEDFMDTSGEITEPAASGSTFMESAVVGGSFVLDPANLVPGAALATAGRGAVKGASMLGRGVARVTPEVLRRPVGSAIRYGVNSTRMNTLARRVDAAFNSPTRAVGAAAGRSLARVGRGFERVDAWSRSTMGRTGAFIMKKGYLGTGIMGGALVGGALGPLGSAMGALAGLGVARGAFQSTAAFRDFARIGRGARSAGAGIETAANLLTSPLHSSILRSRNLTANRTGRRILNYAASNRMPVRAMVYAAGATLGRGTALADATARGAMLDGTLGYIATNDLADAASEAGSGATIAGAGNILRQSVYDPIAWITPRTENITGLGRVWSLGETSTRQQWERQFVRDFERSRTPSEREALTNVPFDVRYRSAQLSTIMQGMATDGRADITDEFTTREGFSQFLANNPGEAPFDLPESWGPEARQRFWMDNPALPSGLTTTVGGRPRVILRTDVPNFAGIGVHEYMHALTDLQGYDSSYDPDERELRQFERAMVQNYGEGYQLEQLNEAERAERSRIYGDPIAGAKSQLFQRWFAEDGQFRAELPSLYEEYYNRLDVPLLSREDINRGVSNGVPHWQVMNAREQENATRRIFDEVLAEKTRNLMEGIRGEILPRLFRIASENPNQSLLLDAYTNGVLGKLERGLESVGATSNVFPEMGTSGSEAQIIAQLFTAKAAMSERLGLAPMENVPGSETTWNDINTDNVEEFLATGLIDEAHYEATGEIRQATRDTAREWATRIHRNVVDAIGSVQTRDRNSVRRLVNGDLAGRYFHPDQLNALLDSDLPQRVKLSALAMNEHLLANQHPQAITRPPMAPLSILYYNETGRGRRQARRHEIQPYEIGTSQRGNFIVRAVHMGILERGILPNRDGGGLDPAFLSANEYMELASQYVRGNRATLTPEQASVLERDLSAAYRTFRLDRIGASSSTSDINPRPRFAPNVRDQFDPGDWSALQEFRKGTRPVDIPPLPPIPSDVTLIDSNQPEGIADTLARVLPVDTLYHRQTDPGRSETNVLLKNGYTLKFSQQGNNVEFENLTSDPDNVRARKAGELYGPQILAGTILHNPEIKTFTTLGVGEGHHWGKSPYTGFKTWPRWGFENTSPLYFFTAPMMDIVKMQALADPNRNGGSSLLALTETPEGRALWAKYGSQVPLKFDTTPGSPSMQRFIETLNDLSSRADKRNGTRFAPNIAAKLPEGTIEGISALARGEKLPAPKKEGAEVPVNTEWVNRIAKDLAFTDPDAPKGQMDEWRRYPSVNASVRELAREIIGNPIIASATLDQNRDSFQQWLQETYPGEPANAHQAEFLKLLAPQIEQNILNRYITEDLDSTQDLIEQALTAQVPEALSKLAQEFDTREFVMWTPTEFHFDTPDYDVTGTFDDGNLTLDLYPGENRNPSASGFGIGTLAGALLRVPEIKKIDVTAAGSGTLWETDFSPNRLTGFKTWPRLGFDTAPDFSFETIANVFANKSLPDSFDIQEVAALRQLGLRDDGTWSVARAVESKHGQRLWSKYGVEVPVTFDTSPESENVQRFDQFLRDFQRPSNSRFAPGDWNPFAKNEYRKEAAEQLEKDAREGYPVGSAGGFIFQLNTASKTRAVHPLLLKYMQTISDGAAKTEKALDLLGHIKNPEISTQWVTDIVQRLNPELLVIGTTPDFQNYGIGAIGSFMSSLNYQNVFVPDPRYAQNPRLAERVMTHELIHWLTMSPLSDNIPVEGLSKFLNYYKESLKKVDIHQMHSEDAHALRYATTNEKELVAQAFSSPVVQKLLMSLPATIPGTVSLFGSLMSNVYSQVAEASEGGFDPIERETEENIAGLDDLPLPPPNKNAFIHLAAMVEDAILHHTSALTPGRVSNYAYSSSAAPINLATLDPLTEWRASSLSKNIHTQEGIEEIKNSPKVFYGTGLNNSYLNAAIIHMGAHPELYPTWMLMRAGKMKDVTAEPSRSAIEEGENIIQAELERRSRNQPDTFKHDLISPVKRIWPDYNGRNKTYTISVEAWNAMANTDDALLPFLAEINGELKMVSLSNPLVEGEPGMIRVHIRPPTVNEAWGQRETPVPSDPSVTPSLYQGRFTPGDSIPFTSP